MIFISLKRNRLAGAKRKRVCTARHVFRCKIGLVYAARSLCFLRRLLFSCRELQKRPREQNLGVLRTAAEVKAGFACFVRMENCEKSPAWTELGCFADCGGGKSRLSPLFCFTELLKTSIMKVKNVAVCEICR